jgi:hypothetical protein
MVDDHDADADADADDDDDDDYVLDLVELHEHNQEGIHMGPTAKAHFAILLILTSILTVLVIVIVIVTSG